MKYTILISCFLITCLSTALNAQDPGGKPTQTITSTQKSTITQTTSSPDSDDLEYDNYEPFQGDTHDSFDWGLVKASLLKAPSNVIISPLSVKYLLAVLWEAAGGTSTTKKELSTILPPGEQFDQRDALSKIVNSLKQKSDSYDLKFDSRIYFDLSIEATQRIAAIAETHYHILFERLDFNDAARSAEIINKWCSEATNGQIQKLVDQSDISNSAMLLLNAIYFKGLWLRPFPKNQTSEFVFNVSSKSQIKTTYMVQTASYYYTDSAELNAKIIRIPYKGKKFAMIIALPNAADGLNQLVQQLDSTTLRKVERALKLDEIHVALPKFKFETTTNMNDLIKGLGIQEIFTTEASLPLLAHGAGPNQLHVSNIKQKAGIQIDEEGSTVYAATEISVVNKLGVETKEFVADRPFLFFIEDETTGALLFGGKVSNPSEFNGAG